MSKNMLVPRFLESLVGEMLADFPIVVILGPRQAGKTTLAKQFADKVGPYVSLDDEGVRSDIELRGIGKFLSELGRGAVIDEVHRWPRMTNALKNEVDERPGSGRFLLAGPSSISAMSLAGDTLAGRACFLTLLPLSQAEIRGGSPNLFLDFLLGDRTDAKGTICTSFDLFRAIAAGGYPSLMSRNSTRERAAWLRNYCKAVRKHDMPAFGRMSARYSLLGLLRHLAAQATQTLSIDQLRKQVALNHATASKILGILEDLQLIVRLPNYLPGPDEISFRKMPKLHFSDAGMLAALLKISAATLERGPLKPAVQEKLFEAFVYSEIAKLCHAQDEDVSLCHWRERNREVDLVIEHEGGVVGVQAVRSQQVRKEHFAHLEELASLSGRMRRGVVVYAGEECLSFEHAGAGGKVTMLALPVSMLYASERGTIDDAEARQS